MVPVGAIAFMPSITKSLISLPNPPIVAAIIGIRISAIIGEAFFWTL